MDWLTGMRIGTRVGGAFAVLIVLLAVVCAFSALNSRRLAADLQETASVDLVKLDLASGLGQDAGVVARASRELLLLDSAGPLKRQRKLVMDSLAKSEERMAKLRPTGTLVILRDIRVGMRGAEDEPVSMGIDQHMGDLYPFTLRQKLACITENA